MFYKFNSMVGRITSSTQTEAYAPQGIKPQARASSQVIFDSKRTKPVHETVSKRPASSTPMTSPLSNAEPGKTPGGVVPTDPGYRRIMDLQNQFLKQDGLMVWQKLGRDRFAYSATIGLMSVGLVMALGQIYSLSFPKKPE